MTQSIRRQLIGPLLTGLLLLVTVIAGLSAWVQSSRSLAEIHGRQRAAARVIRESAFPLTGSVLRQLAELTGQQLMVWDPVVPEIIDSTLPEVPAGLSDFCRSLTSHDGENPDVDPETLRFESGTDVYFVLSTQSRWNPRYRILLLMPRQTLEAARWNAVWPPVLIGIAAFAAMVPWILRLTTIWTGRIRTIQHDVALIARGERPKNVLTETRQDELTILWHDVQKLSSQLEQLQSRLVQAEREQLLAQLATGFAHQFRNGIAGASLALQLHQQRCKAVDDKSLTIAARQMSILETEVRGLLSLGRKPDAPTHPFHVAVVIRECLDCIAPAIEHHQIRLESEPLAEAAVVRGSRDGLRSAILNLLQNAIDASGRGGRIRVDLQQTISECSIQVSDNGPGPRPEVADRMSEPFVTTKPEGIGLGLTIVSEVARQYGGSLRWSRTGEWTTMQLCLPCSLSPERSELLHESCADC